MKFIVSYTKKANVTSGLLNEGKNQINQAHFLKNRATGIRLLLRMKSNSKIFSKCFGTH